eukprot:m.1129274 g.1129274  ORF g.1129274 m.1129274 type:complete len:851 (+) comp24416_c0_seq7:1112-3664(+)
MSPPAALQPPPQYSAVSQATKDMLFPPEYNSLIGINNTGGYPPLPQNAPPPIVTPPVDYNHDFRSPDDLKAPEINFAGSNRFEVWRCGVHIEANYSTAFVTMSLVFRAPQQASKEVLSTALFLLPQPPSATVSECRMTVGSNRPTPRPFAVTVLSTSDAEKLSQQSTGDGNEQAAAPAHANAFATVVPGVEPGDDVTIDVTYFERVESFGSTYELLLPLAFSSQHMPLDAVNQRCFVTVALNAGVRNFEARGYQFPGVLPYRLHGWSTTHQLWANQETPTRLRGQIVCTNPWPLTSASALQGGKVASDFILQYTTVTDTIMGHCIVERPPPNSYDPKSTFALFLTPPTPVNLTVHRRIVFVMDKSYSMSGKTFESAKEALMQGIAMLRPGDCFAIITFSHTFACFPTSVDSVGRQQEAGAATGVLGGFLPSTPDNIMRATKWIRSQECDGMTDILGAITRARDGFLTAGTAPPGVLDVVFLLTDGAVADERDICKFVGDSMGGTRMLTFGVGTYCNTAFLRMLSRMGRGHTDICVNTARVKDQMLHLLAQAATPIMTDLRVSFQGDMYPRQIPDLYAGGTVVVAGQFQGFLGSVEVTGRLPGQAQPYTMTITAETNAYMPLHRLFVKTMMDDLTAEAWLNNSRDLEQRVVDISVNENMPCNYTTMVVHPDAPEGSSDTSPKTRRGQKGYNAATAAAVVGGAVALGAGVLLLSRAGAFDSFGNVAATAANSPIVALASAGEGLVDIAGGIFDGVAEGVNACDCCNCGGCVESIFSEVSNVFSGWCDSCGQCLRCDAVGNPCDHCGNCTEGCGNCADCGNCDVNCDCVDCDQMGDIAGGCCEIAGSCLEALV